METIRTNLKYALGYIKAFLKWIVIAAAVGCIGGLLGSLFHICVDKVTELRTQYPSILYLLPIGGIAIAGMYRLFSSKGKIDTDRVIVSVGEGKNIPLVMIPLIFISTILTHLLGGSAGREGAALQLGGSIGYNLGKTLRLNEKDMRIIVMSGMSAVFAALFGTPITAAVFSLEVTKVGIFHYAGMLPCVISSIVASQTAKLFGLHPVRFDTVVFDSFSGSMMGRIIILATLCALVSVLFCTAIKKTEHIMDKFIKNSFVRAFAGGILIILLTLIVRTRDYNGAGMDVITRAIGGEANPEAFILKIIFTAITISAGFKGGEIVPSFFIGSTLGCAVAPLLGLDASVAAAIGFISLFCGVVNCPIASILLSIEVFGGNGLLFFAIACSVSYMMSGCFGLYHSQKILYSKVDDEYIDVYTK